QLVEALDLLAADRGLEGEIEALERLHSRKPGRAHGRLQAAVVSELDLCTEQALDRLGRGEGASVHAAEDLVQRFERAGHLEIGQHAPDPGSARGGGLHRPAPASAAWTARGRRSTSIRGTEVARRSGLADSFSGRRTSE